eukprot:366444-Chlamydomonas_euryale.AAC.27
MMVITAANAPERYSPAGLQQATPGPNPPLHPASTAAPLQRSPDPACPAPSPAAAPVQALLRALPALPPRPDRRACREEPVHRSEQIEHCAGSVSPTYRTLERNRQVRACKPHSDCRHAAASRLPFPAKQSM